MSTLPPSLVDQLKKGQIVLFLGAGASIGAIHPDGQQPPIGSKLGELLDNHFLGGAFKGYPLDKIAELAISETDLFTVQEFVKNLLDDFTPNTFHKLIPTLPWKAIATTNYDLIVERAYNEVDDRIQQAVVFKKDGERVEAKLTLPNHIPYIKLHGCITEIHNLDVPLILTPEQYISHKESRKRLFSRLLDLAHEHSFVFAGYTLADPNIRAIIQEVESLKTAKPRSYLVTPSMTEIEQRMWSSKKITPILLNFEQFLTQVDKENNSILRKLVADTQATEHPVQRKFNSHASKVPSEALWILLSVQVEFLHSGLKIEKSDPKAFYKGYFVDWSPIESNLDVTRKVLQEIMLEVFLEDERNRVRQQELVVIKGYAGSGKSVLLKRVAWEAAITLDKFCLFYLERNRMDNEALLELSILVKERIFLFIDNAAEHVVELNRILAFAYDNKIPLTIITAERANEWNETCQYLDPFVTTSYELTYLNRLEIKGLISLLEKHRSLGHLEGLSEEDRIHQFEIRAERQLLVALHEVTHGKPLVDIVVDEYNSIQNQKAKLLYITVAILHRVGVKTRAGVISRIHNISFSDFKNELYAPLQYIVFDTKDRITNDIYYHTRHSHIADVLFEQVLSKPDSRFHYYSQILSVLNIDYESDREAFTGMTKARELMKVFSGQPYILDIYEIASVNVGENPNLMHQKAIFEMNRFGGDFILAEEMLQEAKALAPWNKGIAHSLAELQLKRAGRSDNEYEKEKFRRSSLNIARKLISSDEKTPHAYHTLLKIGLQTLEEVLPKMDTLLTQNTIKDFEQNMTEALREFPNESFILEAESQYKTLVEKHPEALEALEKAFANNKKARFIAMRLANTYSSLGRVDAAISVLKECVKHNPTDKDINYRLARLLLHTSGSPAEVKHFLRASFVKGGSGYEAQFWFARILYIEDNFKEANQIFDDLDNASTDSKWKHEMRGVILSNNRPAEFRGTINSIHASFAFLTRDGLGDRIFISRERQKKDKWDKFRTSQRVKFKIGFTYRGAEAFEIDIE